MKAALLIFSTVILVASGCASRTLAKACAEDFGRFEKSFEEANLALARALDGRAPAEEGQDWIRWAEDRLAESQATLDLLEEDPSRREAFRAVSEIATLMVEFHGYAQRGQKARMLRVLEKVREGRLAARDRAC